MTGATLCEISLLLRHAGRRILLIEDNALNREITQILLTKVGLAADTADNGYMALEMAARRCYDLVVTDLAMPGLDGVETAQRLRRLAGYDATPIIALTACVFGEDREYCLSNGLDDFIAKPVGVGHLYETLLRWLDRSEESQESTASEA